MSDSLFDIEQTAAMEEFSFNVEMAVFNALEFKEYPPRTSAKYFAFDELSRSNSASAEVKLSIEELIMFSPYADPIVVAAVMSLSTLMFGKFSVP